MATPSGNSLSSRLRRRVLMRGESIIFMTGIATAMIVVIGLAAVALWTVETNREIREQTDRDRLNGVASLLADMSESMLAEGELTSLRRILTTTAQEQGLATCRIVLPDGSIVADADPGSIDTPVLPAEWPTTWTVAEEPVPGTGSAQRVFPLLIPQRGEAKLIVVCDGVAPELANLRALAGIGGVTIVMLGAFLLAYRRLRSRLRAIGAVQESLSLYEAGERRDAALRVARSFGPEAATWNAVLEDMAQLRIGMANEQATAAMRSRRTERSTLDRACDALWFGLVIIDERMSTSYINGAAAMLLHVEREKMLGQDVRSLFDHAELLQAIDDIFQRGSKARTTLQIEHQSGEWEGVLRVGVRGVHEKGVTNVLVAIEDVTQQCVASAAQSGFVTQATHELRAPLTNIRMYIEAAIECGDDDVEHRGKCLNVINREAQRLERIVGDMLSVSEIEAGSLQLSTDDVRLDRLFEELQADFEQHAHEKSIKLTFNIPPKVPVIQGDRDKIMLALHNLVGNAIKYTPEGGAVNVDVDIDEDGLKVNVSDTGIGIAGEDLEHVFDKFYRANDERLCDITGSGLGLPLAREVVRLHGGDITVDSEINEGSTFHVLFPSFREAA